ncbi:hypothetical protein BH11BAC4_BH11BAC4_04140 [soil metagenome]
MKQYKFTIILSLITFFILIIAMACQNKPTQKKTMDAVDSTGIVVMELFTSQGCSSCPPADKLLGKYAMAGDDHIIPLAFHVDYWNRLGWADPFSSPKFSKRQRDYSILINGSSVYTPQLVINGEKELVGSDEANIAAIVKSESMISPAVHISINKIETNDKLITVIFNLDKTIKFTTIQAALVQKKVSTNILRGENIGIQLINYNVVRDFNSVPAGSKNLSIGLNIPAGLNEKDFTIVLYAQDDASGKITAAAQKAL